MDQRIGILLLVTSSRWKADVEVDDNRFSGTGAGRRQIPNMNFKPMRGGADVQP
jgi:hypothetical protein